MLFEPFACSPESDTAPPKARQISPKFQFGKFGHSAAKYAKPARGIEQHDADPAAWHSEDGVCWEASDERWALAAPGEAGAKLIN